MNYLALRYFLEVAHCLNFSQAAEKLHISQPGLSQQINALEKELGMKLLYRSTRKVSLTEEGEYLYQKLLPSFENIERTIMELTQGGTVPQMTIRIATVPSAASNLLPFLLQKLKQRYPNIEFYLKETTSVDAVELVQKSGYHLAFIRTPIDLKQSIPKPLQWMEFTRYPLKAVVSRQHFAASYDAIGLHELRHETFLHYDPKHSPALYFLLEHACLTAGFIPKTIGAGPEILTIANLIANGIGITLMPEDMLHLLKSYNIKGIDLLDLSLFSSISVVWNEVNLPAVAQHALQILKQLPAQTTMIDKS